MKDLDNETMFFALGAFGIFVFVVCMTLSAAILVQAIDRNTMAIYRTSQHVSL